MMNYLKLKFLIDGKEMKNTVAVINELEEKLGSRSKKESWKRITNTSDMYYQREHRFLI